MKYSLQAVYSEISSSAFMLQMIADYNWIQINVKYNTKNKKIIKTFYIIKVSLGNTIS